jgi:hypothetical protein
MRKYFMAPEFAPGAYFINENDLPFGAVKAFYPELFEPRHGKAPKVIVERDNGTFIFHQATLMFQHTVSAGYDAYDLRLYQLSEGGFVSIVVCEDVADVTDNFSRHIMVHATHDDAMRYLAQEIKDANYDAGISYPAQKIKDAAR